MRFITEEQAAALLSLDVELPVFQTIAGRLQLIDYLLNPPIVEEDDE